MNTKLIKEDGSEVTIGQRILTFRGEMVEVTGWKTPHKPSSEGRVHVRLADGASREFFPSVIGCHIVS
jgi:hypothetical protein